MKSPRSASPSCKGWNSAATRSAKISRLRCGPERAKVAKLPELVRELKANKVDVIVAVSYPVVLA